MKWKLFLSGKAFFGGLACILFVAGSAFAEKSMWQKFKDFFNPGESIDCEGPVCDEIHQLDGKISKVEGKYSRERRPANKDRYKKELDSLNVIRDSLVVIVMEQQKADSLKALSSSAGIKSSAAVASISAASSATIASSSAAVAVSSAVVEACIHDTVYVRDTIVVHDTLYVVLANKPAETAPAQPVAPALTDSSASADSIAVPASSSK